MKTNIILSRFKPSLANDTEIFKSLLHDDLHIDSTITCCIRDGQARLDRPKLLIATLASEVDARAAARSATSLRKRTVPNVRNRVYLNADLTKERRLTELRRAELKRHLHSELNLVIRDGRIITKPPSRSPTHENEQQSTPPTLYTTPLLVASPAASTPRLVSNRSNVLPTSIHCRLLINYLTISLLPLISDPSITNLRTLMD